MSEGRGIFAALLGSLAMALLCGCSATCRVEAGVQDEISARRELRFLGPVDCRELRQSQVQSYLRNSVELRNDPARLASEGQAFKLIGILPPDYNYPEDVITRYAGELLALYSPEEKAMIYLSRAGAEKKDTFRKSVVQHELVHALQDQHYDVGRFLEQEDSNDAILSRMALLEGDANFSTREGELGEACENVSPSEMFKRLAATESADDTPKAIRFMMEFPYLFGERFVCQLHDRGGWNAVNQAYSDLPTTTYEIVYPDAYLARGKNSPAAYVPRYCSAEGSYKDSFGLFLGFAYLRTGHSTELAFQTMDSWRGDFVVFNDAEQNLCWEIQLKNSDAAKALQDLIDKTPVPTHARRSAERHGDTVVLKFRARGL